MGAGAQLHRELWETTQTTWRGHPVSHKGVAVCSPKPVRDWAGLAPEAADSLAFWDYRWAAKSKASRQKKAGAGSQKTRQWAPIWSGHQKHLLCSGLSCHWHYHAGQLIHPMSRHRSLVSCGFCCVLTRYRLPLPGTVELTTPAFGLGSNQEGAVATGGTSISPTAFFS